MGCQDRRPLFQVMDGQVCAPQTSQGQASGMAPLKPFPCLTSLSAPRGRWSWRLGPPIGIPPHVSGSLSLGPGGGHRWGLRPLGIRAGSDVGGNAGTGMKLVGKGESKLPWAGEELVLTPTGAWLEVVGGSGTPLPAPTCPVRRPREPPPASVPSSTVPLPTPTPTRQAHSSWLHCSLTGGPSPQ